MDGRPALVVAGQLAPNGSIELVDIDLDLTIPDE